MKEIKKRREYVRKTPYPVDENKFVNSENLKRNEAYILGFLWADSNIDKYSINLELVNDDIIDILPIFQKVGTWNYYQRQRKVKGEDFGVLQGKLNTSNKILVKFLIDMGYTNKNIGPSKILNHIKDEYHIDFWHGFFDGDGSLYVSKSVSLQFWSSIDQDWTPLIKFLKSKEIQHKIWKYERLKKNGNIHRSSCLGVKNTLNILRLLSLFYSKELMGLHRKYIKFLELEDKIKNKKRKYPKTGTRFYV